MYILESIKDESKYSQISLTYLINIWQMSWQSHNLNQDQTKHPTENFISQNLFKIH